MLEGKINMSEVISEKKQSFYLSDPYSPFWLTSAIRINQSPTRWISLMDGDKGWLVWCRILSIDPLPHMPILGSLNSAANKDMMSKIWTNGDTII